MINTDSMAKLATSIDDLPPVFDDLSDGAKRVARPIYNTLTCHFNSNGMAAIHTVKHLAQRGIMKEVVFDHEEESS